MDRVEITFNTHMTYVECLVVVIYASQFRNIFNIHNHNVKLITSQMDAHIMKKISVKSIRMAFSHVPQEMNI